MKILSLGNSFSQDAHKWLHSLAAANNEELNTYNLYIGGCSLAKHWHCITNNLCNYEFQGNNGDIIGNIGVLEALQSDKYDIVTLQQASGFSGQPQSYIPYLTHISDYVKKYQPQAKIYFHKTWSYEIDSSHPHFIYYNNDQKEMYRRISDATLMASSLIDANIIPVGDTIQMLRESTKEFDYKNGGLSLCRDGFHLSYDYGRFAAAATWYKTLMGKSIKCENFARENNCFNPQILNIIIGKLEEFSMI